MRHKLRVANIRHCRYCIPIHQAAQLSRADPGVSRAFLYKLTAWVRLATDCIKFKTPVLNAHLVAFSCSCWGNTVQKMPKAPSFVVSNLIGMSIGTIVLQVNTRRLTRSRISDVTSYFQDGGMTSVHPPLAGA